MTENIPRDFPAVPSPHSARHSDRSSPRSGARAWLAWGYLGLVLLYWGALSLAGDRIWWGTVLPLLPAWPLALPLFLLLPLCWTRQRKHWSPLVLAALVLLFPISRLCIPWQRAMAAADGGHRIRVLTWNLGSRPIDFQGLEDLIDTDRPDVITLQERFDTERLTALLEARGYHVAMQGPSLLTAARFPLADVERFPIGWTHGLVRSRVLAPWGPFAIVNVHLSTPRWELEVLGRERGAGVATARRLLEQRRDESRRASAWASDSPLPTIVVGDFNLTTKSALYRRDWAAFSNAFSRAGWGWGHTKTTRFLGVRIDHVLCSPPWRPARSWVGPDLGSDHRPLLADLHVPE